MNEWIFVFYFLFWDFFLYFCSLFDVNIKSVCNFFYSFIFNYWSKKVKKKLLKMLFDNILYVVYDYNEFFRGCIKLIFSVCVI